MALSTAEAEYIALSGGVQEAIWIRQLITELSGKHEPTKGTVIYEDNQSATYLAKNPQFISSVFGQNTLIFSITSFVSELLIYLLN